MNLTPTMKRGLAIGGISLLAVVGVVGLTREARPAPDATVPAASNWYAPAPSASYDPNTRVVYAPSPFGSEAPVAAAPDPEPVALTAPAVEPARVAPQRRYVRSTGTRHRRVYVEKRPFKHSAAIVGGAAAGGALIGALAGGGKGAAIGALAGGGGGLVYDRLTHKKKVVR
jgi:hypothetical protein